MAYALHIVLTLQAIPIRSASAAHAQHSRPGGPNLQQVHALDHGRCYHVDLSLSRKSLWTKALQMPFKMYHIQSQLSPYENTAPRQLSEQLHLPGRKMQVPVPGVMLSCAAVRQGYGATLTAQR